MDNESLNKRKMIRGSVLKMVVVLCVVLASFVACMGGGVKRVQATDNSENRKEPTKNSAPTRYTYSVKRIYPHSETSYTQGLFWHDGALWESTGNYGESELLEVDLQSGKQKRGVPLLRDQFGEGAAVLNGKIYQLTWLEGVALVYDAATIKKSGEFRYAGEGWGLTTDGERLFMSDGSHQIHVINPATFERDTTINVRIGLRNVMYVNELEWIEGRIWANIYDSEEVVIIDPTTGQVEGIIDFSGLLPASDRTPDTDVFNGIAYDPATKRIYVTGKNWNKLFEVEIAPK